MSASIILDGTGTRNKAKVDFVNRVHVDSVGRTQIEQAVVNSDAYNLFTGNITLTSDSESAIWFLKYTGDKFLIIKEVLVVIASSTSGSGDAIITLMRNPSGGTIESNASPIAGILNRNFASSNQLSANIYKGAEGYTLTNGDQFASTRRSNFEQPVAFDAATILLEKGNTIGLKYTPPSGNTSQVVIVAATLFEENKEARD
jgi:hypothetical protein